MEEFDPMRAFNERKEAVGEKFFHWLKEAEAIVDAHYPTENSGARSALVAQIANSLMLQHLLGEIDYSLDAVRCALENPSWS